MYLFEYEKRQSGSIVSLPGSQAVYPKRYTCVKACDFARFILYMTIFRHLRLFVQRCSRITLDNVDQFTQQYTPALIHITLHFIHMIGRTRMPPERTQCLYTPFSRAHPHIALNNHTCIVCVNVTCVLQSTRTLCELCDNLSRVPHATPNKIKHLRVLNSWHVSRILRRH